ncbi:MAG: hypothetical protein SAK29_28485 [Scytonema sp. PMC 1069.18]|nr:hypothetical protein [Scytonema sp. PMC 1069.18]MEC4880005.1 hypothetical protein [Scytonema sp. PMC 1070.18]
MNPSIHNPLSVIIDPSGIQFGMPGDIIELHITILNQGEQSAVIDLFLDEGLQSLTRSDVFHRASVALDPQQSQEITFQVEIPIDALPGTYDYTLVVDSPNHYPQYTPINYPRQIKVLLKEQTVVRASDPTFSLQPATNPNKPLVFRRGEPLQVEVIVDNRSSRVDRFRLSCPDLDEDWYTIVYPRTGLEGQGLLSDVTALELLPTARGHIRLELHPPTDTFAGNYSPTIRLHSENSPDLVLLELVYILVPTIYRLDVTLDTILGKVSRTSGKYEVKLANQGNTVRELMLSAKSRDEEELFTYKYKPVEVRLLPGKKAGSNLTIKPKPWWRRPLFGSGLVLNFQVEIKDKEDLPLPDSFPEGSLLWKARPWWQFLLLILVILGLMGGIGFLIWRLLNPEPLRLENFRVNAPRIIEGNEVLLSWEIHNYQQLQKLDVIQTQPPLEKPLQSYDNLSELISKGNTNQSTPCQIQKDILSCTNVTTGVKKKDTYIFEIKAEYRKNIPIIPQTNQVASSKEKPKVEIVDKPIAEVVAFNADKSEYKNGETALFSWQIKLPVELRKIEMTGKAEDGTLVSTPVNFNFANDSDVLENLKKQKLDECKIDNNSQQLNCKNVPVTVSKPGTFTFELKAFSQGSDRTSSQQTPTKIKVLPKPLRIVYFRLNESEESSRVFTEGDTLVLKWKVEGESGTRVELAPFGTVDLQGEKRLTANQGLQSPIQLIVSDLFGSPPVKKGFSFQVIKPEPPPTPSEIPVPTQFPIPTPQG